MVTSNGTTSGSAVLWTIWSSGESGTGSELRAYDPVPVGGVMKEIWSAPVGTSSKFNPPGVAGNRIYVGTRDGNIICFGAPTTAPVSASSPNFGDTLLGQYTTRTVTITATAPVTISSVTSTTGPFSVDATLPLPDDLTTGQSATVVVTFGPTTLGTATGELTVTTAGAGAVQVGLSANGVSPPVSPPIVGMASTPTGSGYWIADSRGDVQVHGDAAFYGSIGDATLNAPINHIVATPDGKGYWLVAGDGGTFGFGSAAFYGSMGGRPLNAPVVDLAPTPDGKGYWLVATDGGIFAFGDAAFHGSMGGRPLNRPVVGMAGDGVTGGYWLVATDGGIFAFDAPFYGSTGSLVLNQPVNGMAAAAGGAGYWFVASDGGVFAFGGAAFQGSAGGIPLVAPVVGMAADLATGGYWLVASDGGIFSYGAPFLGSGA